MLFAVVMGFGGLSLAWQVAGIAPLIASLLSWLTAGLLGVITLFYLAKLLRYGDQVTAEWHHPIRINFFAAIAISFMLVAKLLESDLSLISPLLWMAGLILQTIITFLVLRSWIERAVQIEHSNPAWFIPVVGNLIVPISAPGFAPFELLFFYFSLGIFFWVVLFSVIFYRLLFHPQLAAKFIPTLFIFIAPPAVGFLDYLHFFGYDPLALMLYNLALVFAGLLLVMARRFWGLPFFISWWAFTFPLAALTLATFKLQEAIGGLVLTGFGLGLLAATSLMVLTVAAQTLRHIQRGEICVQEG
jgi:tellurite resistance protein